MLQYITNLLNFAHVNSSPVAQTGWDGRSVLLQNNSALTNLLSQYSPDLLAVIAAFSAINQQYLLSEPVTVKMHRAHGRKPNS